MKKDTVKFILGVLTGIVIGIIVLIVLAFLGAHKADKEPNSWDYIDLILEDIEKEPEGYIDWSDFDHLKDDEPLKFDRETEE